MSQLPQVIPVLDLLRGQVVHGRAGRRAEYRPIRSELAHSADPAAVAQAFRDRLGLRVCYLADLDAIAGAEPAWPCYRNLISLGVELWVDAGVRDAHRAEALVAAGVRQAIIGLETLPSVQALHDLAARVDPAALTFSLDLRDGRPITQLREWSDADPLAICRQVVLLGFRRIIALDLVHVGMGTGTGTEALCSQLRRKWPDVELIAGGGVRTVEDLRRLAQVGVNKVLVASALHDGRIRREDLIP